MNGLGVKPVPKEMSRFLEMVRKFADVSSPAYITVLAHLSGDQWMNLTTLVRFGGSPVQETAFDINHRMTVYSTRKSTLDAANLLGEAAQYGQFRVLHMTINFPGSTSTFLQERMDRVYFYSTQYNPGQNSATVLSINGGGMDAILAQTQGDWAELESDIQKLDPPYLGLADLSESHLGYPIGKGYNTTIYALLLIPCKLLGADVSKEGKLQLKLRRDARIGCEDVAFGVVSKAEAGIPSRHTILLSKSTIVQEEKGIELVQLDVSVAGTSEVVIQLRVRGETLEATRLYPGIASPRLRCHSILDPEGVFLEKVLTNVGGVPFEQGVAMLLHVAGFKVEITSTLEKLASESYADVLAFTPDEGSLIIGACVFKNVKPQDVTQLAQTRLVTETALGEGKPAMLSIIFSSMPEKTIPASLREQAQREQIRICPKEELLKILALVKSGGGTPEVLQLLGQGIWFRF